MGLKYLLLGVCLLLSSNGISNQELGKHLITDEERRGAIREQKSDVIQEEPKTKRGLLGLSSLGVGGYGHSGYGSSGHGYGGDGHGYYGSGHGHQGYGGYGHPSAHGYDHDIGYGHSSHGGDYGPSYGHHGGGVSHGQNALALKALLIPLAGIALIGAAAAYSTNPVLLQIGLNKGRKRRNAFTGTRNVYPANPKVRPQ